MAQDKLKYCPKGLLTLKAPITTAADDIHKYFFIVVQRNWDDVSSDSSARWRIHMKNQALFSSKDKSKKLKCRLLQFVYGALRVKLKQATNLSLCHTMFLGSIEKRSNLRE